MIGNEQAVRDAPLRSIAATALATAGLAAATLRMEVWVGNVLGVYYPSSVTLSIGWLFPLIAVVVGARFGRRALLPFVLAAPFFVVRWALRFPPDFDRSMSISSVGGGFGIEIWLLSLLAIVAFSETVSIATARPSIKIRRPIAIGLLAVLTIETGISFLPFETLAFATTIDPPSAIAVVAFVLVASRWQTLGEVIAAVAALTAATIVVSVVLSQLPHNEVGVSGVRLWASWGSQWWTTAGAGIAAALAGEAFLAAWLGRARIPGNIRLPILIPASLTVLVFGPSLLALGRLFFGDGLGLNPGEDYFFILIPPIIGRESLFVLGSLALTLGAAGAYRAPIWAPLALTAAAAIKLATINAVNETGFALPFGNYIQETTPVLLITFAYALFGAVCINRVRTAAKTATTT
ncbi:MAG: hypothetical protein PVI23_09340 [Maricaulaceae bacterium]|jgi:hypothetical protein